MTLAFEVFVVGLSMDKAIAQLDFFWKLSLHKSQVDSMLRRLAREWEAEFKTLCTLLADSAVVYADATSWSINSVCGILESLRGSVRTFTLQGIVTEVESWLT